MKMRINQNVNYANHTNSSSPKLNNSSATSDSLATIIRDNIIVIEKEVDLDIENTNENQITNKD